MSRDPGAAGAAAAGAGLGAGLLALLTLVAGVSVANLYYAQPLLPGLAASLGASASAIGYVPMLTQVGYAAGLFLFIPLGDAVERRRLIVVLTATSAAALLGVAAAPGLASLALASFVVGLTTVAPHVALPLAAHLAAPSDRGRVIGVVMSGVLVGILLARAASGVVGQALGWRAMYVLAALLVAGLGVAVRALLPPSPPTAALRYPALVASLGSLTRAHRALREASLLAALGFAAFSVFWTALAFHLAGPPWFYGSSVAGLFGFVGAAGALAAPIVGRASDRRGARFAQGVALVLALASFGVFAALGRRIWGLVLGVTLLDVGWQSFHVANLTRVQALDPAARSRLNTVYMVALFGGGACGTWTGAHAWSAWGWSGVCAVGTLFVAGAAGVWARGVARERAAAAPGAR